MELQPDSNYAELGESGLKEGFPRRELENDAINQPRSIKEKVLHCFLRRTPNQEKPIEEVRDGYLSKRTPFASKLDLT